MNEKKHGIGHNIRQAVLVTVVLLVLCGLVFPVLLSGLSAVIFPSQAKGSLVTADGIAVGAKNVGQDFTEDYFMWCRPSAYNYNTYYEEDTDGDGNIDVYGFGGWPGDYFMNFVMSNGTNVAATATENLSSPEVGEVLQFIQDLNLVDKVMYPIPEENGWDVCRFLYRDGKVAFTPIAAWIMDSNKDYAFQHPEEPTLDFDMVFIPWPVGPHGNAETNTQKVTANACYVIPVGVEDPELVYNVLYDLLNWYDYDPNSEDGGAAALAIRDAPETLGWWYGVTAKDIDLQDYNFEVMMEMGRHQMLDRYGSLGDDAELPLREFINGDYTTAQLQEKYRQTIQDAIDGILGK